MPIDETVRKYQTTGKSISQKREVSPEFTTPPNSVSMQFNDTKKQELSHGDCPGCMY